MKLFFFCLQLFLTFFPALAYSDAGEIIFTKGEAYLIHNKTHIELKKGLKLDYNDKVVVENNSLVLLRVEPGLTTKVAPNSSLIILPPSKNKNIARPIYLEAGKAFFQWANSDSSKKLEVSAKNVAMGIRGTEFFAAYGKNVGKEKEFWMCVHEGKVKIETTSGGQQMVKKGEGVKVSGSYDISPPRKLPWTDKLNWEFSEDSKDLSAEISIDSVYHDPLGKDYD